ncbi:hypothetical protein PLICRDRAFT_56845 [Plicaturopsis crispa FD-325 SS-3]|nr:hypothetical protein PLICRDRAFT_56845 [Plicaturopsis crispa FD-325 SS-3]
MSSMFSRTLERGSTLSKLMTASAAPVDLDGARPVPDLLSRSLDDIEKLMERGSPVSIKDLPAFIDAVKNLNGIGLDDRKFLLEKLLVFMSRSPDDSEVSTKVQQFVIDTLYKDLPHPPSGYLSVPTHASATSIQSSSHGVKYAYRSADGSNYNPLFPSLGKAGSPYARSVPSTSTTPLSALPDAGLVFDTLLKRDHFEAHPDGISSLFFAFADLVIHCIFNTSHSDWTINDTSSYLDLSVLYGNSEADVDKVRRKDGSGKLWNDVFADARVRFMPPAVCALLVLFNRNHNYIAQKIRDINERGNFDTPGVKDTMAQDDEIFHRSRLVNTGFFMQTILGDYVGAILGLVRDGLAWRLRPLETMRQMDHEFAPQGEGNVVSLEFNLLYRWHACLSAQDAEWTEAEFKKLFDGKDFGSVDIKDFERAAHKYMIPDPDVKTWTFSDLKRESDGRFKDGDLANILQNATEASAGAFKARGIPEALRVVEILGIMQARSWGTCSLNEFRKFMGLKPYKSFKEWNPDPEIHTAAATLYHDIDNLELHVGLQAEDAKKPMPGAGLCPGYTISRAILADAVCLTRGDRFLTVNFTPFNLTSWGYQDCQYNTADGSYGGMLTKLLFRTLPDHYPARSAYAHFPMLVPARARMHLRKLAKDPTGKYMWERPGKPMGLVEVTEYEDVVRVLADGAFESQGDDRMRGLAKGVRVERQMVHELLFADNDVQAWKKYFGETARRLIREKSIDHVGSPAKYVDIVKDVINLVPVHWIANEIIGLPMKTAENPSGTYREYELVEKFQDVANYIYLNAAPDNDWALRESAAHTAHLVRECVKSQLALQSPKGLVRPLPFLTFALSCDV